MVTQKPIVGCKRAVFQRHNEKFYCKTCKKLQNPPFFGFFEVKSPHFDPERSLKPDCPCRGQPYAKAQTAVAKWGYLYLSAGCKLGLPTCGRFRHRPSGVRGQRPRKRSAAVCWRCLLWRNQRETKHTTGERSWAGFPPARRWPSHPPQKPK